MRYRMLDVRIWCDEKFRALSPLKPSAQALFIYLLTNPNTTSIPGLYRAGAAAMAEELGWSLLGFNRALQEIIEQGLVKVDLKARVIFIANAIKYNKPQSPNVVKSWALHWDEIPECALKNEAYKFLKGATQGLGKAFAQAFEESLCKAHAKRQAIAYKPLLNQEQEQEQEQEIRKLKLHPACAPNRQTQRRQSVGGNYMLTVEHNLTVAMGWLNKIDHEEDHFFAWQQLSLNK
ncbi:hypothetical protein [Rickettsiella endosymbiont of Dermanyssus gallinae]|uniref:hypothetical protein n=1 Tax=Rickettsiella endosymbiont of Dermanyssus gallinae TaxID=2856608 RepID=UPI001C52FB9E|nr:hypothetical protein [Rickettsiella endosymbiont of Dermanyssus gallinae]